MARDNRKINSGIRLSSVVNINEGLTLQDGSPAPVVLQATSQVYSGDSQKTQDDLASLLSPKRGAELIEAGVLEGDWDFTGSDAEPEAPAGQVAVPRSTPQGAESTSTSDAGAASGQSTSSVSLSDRQKSILADNFDSPQQVLDADDDALRALGLKSNEFAKVREFAQAQVDAGS